MRQRNPRFSVTLTADQEALLAIEHYKTGHSMAACARSAITRFYADNRKEPTYAAEVRSIRLRRGEEID